MHTVSIVGGIRSSSHDVYRDRHARPTNEKGSPRHDTPKSGRHPTLSDQGACREKSARELLRFAWPQQGFQKGFSGSEGKGLPRILGASSEGREEIPTDLQVATHPLPRRASLGSTLHRRLLTGAFPPLPAGSPPLLPDLAAGPGRPTRTAASITARMGKDIGRENQIDRYNSGSNHNVWISDGLSLQFK